MELEELHKQLTFSASDQNLQRRYKNALVQIEQLMKELTTTREDNKRLIIEVQQYIAQLSALQAGKNKQIEMLIHSKSDFSAFEREIKDLTFKFETEISRLRIQSSRYYQISEAKTKQIEELSMRIKHYQKELSEAHSKITSNVSLINIQNLQLTLKDYESRFTLLGSEIQRLNLVLRDKSSQINEIYIKYQAMERNTNNKDTIIRDLQIHITQLSNEIHLYRQQIERNQVKHSIDIYENKISYLTNQLQRGNELLRVRVDENGVLMRRINEYEYEFRNIEFIKRQNQQLKQSIIELSEFKRRVAEYQSRISTHKLEIERMNNSLIGKNNQIVIYETRNKNLQVQIDNYRKKVLDLESNVSIQWKNKLIVFEQKIVTYSQQNEQLWRRVRQLTEMTHKIPEYENHIAIMSQQIERLTQIIRVKGQQLSNLQAKFRKIQIQLEGYRRNDSNITYQWQTKITSYQQRINHLNKQNEQLKHKIIEASEWRLRVSEYENQFISFKQQIDRLTIIIRSKTQEYNGLEMIYRNALQETQHVKRMLSENQTTIVHEFNARISKYEQTISQYSQEIEEYRRKNKDTADYNRRISEYQNRIALLSHQIQRLTISLKTKIQEIHISQTKNRNIQIELDSFRRRLSEVDSSISHQWSSKVIVFEQRITSLSMEIEDYRRKNKEYEMRFGATTQQLELLNHHLKIKVDQISSLEMKNHTFMQQLDVLRRRLSQSEASNSKIVVYEQRIKQYEIKIVNGSNDFERVNQALRIKIEELNTSENKIRNLHNELQGLRRRFIEMESSISHDWQVKITTYEQRVHAFNVENENLRRKSNDYENRVVHLSQQIEKLNNGLKIKINELNNKETQIKNYIQEIEVLRRRFMEIEGSVSMEWSRKVTHYQQLNAEWNTKVHYYEQTISNLSLQNQELKRRSRQLQELHRRVAEYENRIAISNQEIERLNQTLRKIVDEFNHSESRIRVLQQQLEVQRKKMVQYESNTSHQWNANIINYQQRIVSFSNENQELRRKIKELMDVSRRKVELEHQINNMSQEIQRLNNNLKIKIQELKHSQVRIRNILQQQQLLQRRLQQYEIHTSVEWKNTIHQYEQKTTVIGIENEQLRRALAQSENKHRTTLFQFEKLNQLLRVRDDQLKNYEIRQVSIVQQLEVTKRRLLEFESSVSHQWNSKITIYQQKISIFTQQNQQLKRRLKQLSQGNRRIHEYQNRIAVIKQQNERTNQNLRIRIEEYNASENRCRHLQQQLQSFKRRLVEVESSIGTQWTVKMSSYEKTISNFVVESQELRKRILEYEDRLGSGSHDIQILNNTLRIKIDELANSEARLRNFQGETEILRQKLSQYESTVSHQWTIKVTTYEQAIKRLNQENQELRERVKIVLNQRVGEIEGKITLMGQEIERLNHNLRIKLDQLNNSQSRNRSLQQQLQNHKRKVVEYESSISDQWSIKMIAYQQKIATFSHENEQLRRRVTEITEINRRIPQYQSKIAILSQQIERINFGFRDQSSKSSNINFQLQNLRRRQSQLNIQFQRLSSSLRIKNQEYMRLESTYNEVSVRYEQFESRWNLRQTEYQKLLASYTMVSSEYQSSKKHLQQYEVRQVDNYDSIKKLYGEFERLQSIMQEIRKENYNLKLQIQKSDNQDERVRLLSLQIDRLNQLTEQQRIDLEDVRIRLSDDIALQKRIQEYMALLVVLFAQIESLRQRVKDKEKQVQEVRRSSLAPFKSLRNHNESV